MKKVLNLILLILLSGILFGCSRDIDSYNNLNKIVEEDIEEIYSISYVSFMNISGFINQNYSEISIDDIGIDSGDSAMIYGINFFDEEIVIFVPEKSSYQPYILELNNNYIFDDAIELIYEEYPSIYPLILKLGYCHTLMFGK